MNSLISQLLTQLRQAILHPILRVLPQFLGVAVPIVKARKRSSQFISPTRGKACDRKCIAIDRKVTHAIKLSILGICTAIFITACNGNVSKNRTSIEVVQSPVGDCQVIKHKAGETQVCTQPQKVVVLGSHMLDILLSLGVQPAGFAEIEALQRSDYNNPAEQISYLGSRVTSQPVNVGTRGEPSLELLVQLKPDLILGEIGPNRDEYALLSQIAPTLLFRGSGKDDWQQSIQVIAKVLGRSEKAQQVIEEYNQRLATAHTELAPIVAAHPRVLLLATMGLKGETWVSDHKDYSGGLLEELGFQLMSLPAKANESTAVSLEVLPQLDSDLIFVRGWDSSPDNKTVNAADNPLKNLKQEWRSNAIAQTLNASKEGRVYFVNYYLWSVLRGPIAAELILNELRQFLLSSSSI
jgi:iron complex transport system substrate-binding protein